MGQFDDITFGRDHLAAYACKARDSKGRLFPEAVSPTRTPFQRDRDRIIHSTAFRRLKHKTQVFVYHVGDHYRTRLTHSIEVAQIARSLARALRVDEDLAEALALSHDFGHTPFGHAGEDALDAVMKGHGGFDHNAQSLRIVTLLEHQYAEFDGLNLSWETLEGLVKHNGPVVTDATPLEDVPQYFRDFNKQYDLKLQTYSSVEAQCAAIADDIAYNAHDLDDGLRAGIFELSDLEDVAFAGETLAAVRAKYPNLEEGRVRHEIVRRQITAMVEDAILEARSRLQNLNPQSVDDVRDAGKTIVTFSDEMQANESGIKSFLFEKMYRAPAMMEMRSKVETIISDLYSAYVDGASVDAPLKPEEAADFIAGMTDGFAVREHQRLFDDTPDLG